MSLSSSSMGFSAQFNGLVVESLVAKSETASSESLERSLAQSRLELSDFANLISPAAAQRLDALATRSAHLTRQRFGKVIRLFAPLYLSNECINNCRYCGFSRDNAILRVTLSVEEVLREARELKQQGFRNLLLVAGEHPKFVSIDYLRECVAALHPEIPGISLEVGPLETDAYSGLVKAGAEGLVVYQETYDRRVYADMHTAGPKRDFDWRLETAERAYAAGFRRLGIGALYGMSDWRWEAISLAAHAEYLLRHCWKAQLTISLPRLRPCAGEFDPPRPMSDRELVQLVCALRIFLPDAGLVLSTREPARLRNGLIPLGVTMMSAGSHTEPGGYTGAGREHVHLTQRGRIVPLTESSSEWSAARTSGATGQFDIADERSPAEVANMIARLGLEPVWKDWDAALATSE
ncbi:MAG TPA: 2-iminoacetate synthase ThiH [Candidatus Binatia bacterium]|nr:2-iminoacetate synthase ThiH [Candidatus Binatia bacterium]